jgi:NADPH-dependent curcumin reductase CurA
MKDLRRSIILQNRPKGTPQPHDFSLKQDTIPEPRPGEVLTRTLWLSLDPGMRVRMNEAKSYAPRFEIGAPMLGETVGQVLISRDPRFTPGEIVVGPRGWQSHIVASANALVKLPKNSPYSAYLGVLGMPGTTAYAGMKDIGEPKAGETVVVSAASGAVGSVAGQLAKRAGARVIGVAGGADKAAFVRDVLNFDACIDHRGVGADLASALKDVCSNGIDVYFENVGGDLQQAVFPLMNSFGRMVMCGMAAEYNDAAPRPGPNLGATFLKRLRIQGFICGDHPENFAKWRALAAPWIAEGSLRYREHVVDGLENAPKGFAEMLTGHNFGKVVVRVADPELIT